MKCYTVFVDVVIVINVFTKSYIMYNEGFIILEFQHLVYVWCENMFMKSMLLLFFGDVNNPFLNELGEINLQSPS